MNICVLGWGSLIWNPGGLHITGNWNADGPNFPIEFARISNNARLTLVIKEEFDNVQTLWAISSFKILDSAKNNLMIREGISDINGIGHFDFCNSSSSIRRCEDQLSEELIRWNSDKKFDAIIWTDLGPNFSLRTHRNFAVENLITYLDNLTPAEFSLAKDYILNTPSQIQTRFRRSIENFLATKDI